MPAISPRHPAVLPDELFGFVGELLASDRSYKTLSALSSTSRRMYELLLPSLYRTLVLTPRSMSFLEDLARELWVEDRVASLWFHPANIAWQNTSPRRHFTSPRYRAGMVETVVFDSGLMDTAAMMPLAIEPTNVEFPCSLPRLMPRAKLIILSLKMVDEMLVRDDKQSWLAQHTLAFAGYKRRLRCLSDSVLALASPEVQICVHLSSLDFLSGVQLYDLDPPRYLRWSINNLLAIVTLNFRRTGTNPTLHFCNAPVVPMNIIADVHVAFRSEDRHVRILKDALGEMLLSERVRDDWDSGPHAADGNTKDCRIFMYGGPPETPEIGGVEGEEEEEGEGENDWAGLHSDDEQPLPSRLARDLWTLFRGEAKSHGYETGYPIPENYRMVVPWHRLDHVLRNRLVCRPLPREEIEGICVFCGTDW